MSAPPILAIDAKLAARGFLPLTPWWRAELVRWNRSHRRRFVARVGRGGIKSHTAVKVATAELLGRAWHVPPGERHYFAIVSVSMGEARQRLGQFLAMCQALGVGADRVGDEVQLRDLQLGLRVFAATVGAVSGFRCIGFCGDELAKWRTADDSANPAPEVLASLRAMTVTHPDAREFLISSPWGKDDAHAQLIDAGDTDEQVVACAASWVANPSITEERTRLLERDPRVWAREYAAQAQDAALAAFDASAVAAAMTERPAPVAWGPPIVVCDPSGGRKDSFTFAGARWATAPSPELPEGARVRQLFTAWPSGDRPARDGAFEIQGPTDSVWRPYTPEEPASDYLELFDVRGFEGAFWQSSPADRVCAEIAKFARSIGASVIVGDQRSAYELEAMFRRDHRIKYVSIPYTSQSKQEAVAMARGLMRDRRLALPQHEKLRRELLSFEEKIAPSGALTFGARGSGHDDYCCLLLTACLADAADELRGSPFARGRGVRRINDVGDIYDDSITTPNHHGFGSDFD